MTTTPRPRPRNAGPRARIDWAAAFTAFAALEPPRTYAAVAERYGVSEGAVRRHAKAERWNERVQALDTEAARRAEQKVVRSLEHRMADTIRVADRLRTVALHENSEIDPAVAVRSLPRYVHLELLHAGEATDRVEYAEVERALGGLVERALRHMTAEGRQAFLDELARGQA
jgi:hypothetical protein